MASFSSSVWDAAETGNLHELVTVLTLNPKLVDAPCPSGRRGTPMRIAAVNGHVEIMTKLVELGSHTIDAPNILGWTPMFAAAWNGHVSTIETLVRLGSTAIDTSDVRGRTPMYAAALNGHVSVIETLVRLGSVAIDTPDNNGWTPMLTAAQRGHVSVIETLVRLGSMAIDTPDDIGRTPLYLAACHYQANTVKTLKMLGAKWQIIQRGNIPNSMLTLLNAQENDDETAELRSRVYFSRSLMERLFFELEARRNRKTTSHAQTRFN